MMSRGRPLPLPTDPAQRIHVLDVPRGLALLGMFIVHFHVNTAEPGGFDDAIRAAVLVPAGRHAGVVHHGPPADPAPLRHLQFGPAEWLWRSLTHGRLQPMRRATLPASAVEA